MYGTEPGGIDNLSEFIEALFGEVTQEPPDHWLEQSVQLRNNQRSVEGTIPAFMCQQVGIDRQNPPEVTYYYDPHTDLIFIDLGGMFELEDKQ